MEQTQSHEPGKTLNPKETAHLVPIKKPCAKKAKPKNTTRNPNFAVLACCLGLIFSRFTKKTITISLKKHQKTTTTSPGDTSGDTWDAVHQHRRPRFPNEVRGLQQMWLEILAGGVVEVDGPQMDERKRKEKEKRRGK